MQFSEKISISSVHLLNRDKTRRTLSFYKKKTLTETVRVFFFSYAS